MRRHLVMFAALGAAVLAGSAVARAQTGPVVVIPGKPGVPVMIDGVIADGAIVYGDWGLARPGHGQIIIEGVVTPAVAIDGRGYFPATGRRPRVGRLEAPMPKHPRPRQTDFHREWSAGSNMRAPVTEYPPFNPPEVIMAPPERRHR